VENVKKVIEPPRREGREGCFLVFLIRTNDQKKTKPRPAERDKLGGDVATIPLFFQKNISSPFQ
jgi:hypothetical protein